MLQGSVPQARALRQGMSLPEVLLWQALRMRPNGLKFRRSQPAGRFIADFYCHSARMIVEIDGESHGRGDRPARDARRDAWFAERNLRVLRIPAIEILTNIDDAVRGIIAAAATGGE